MLNELIKILDERAIDAGFASPQEGLLIFDNDPHWPGPPLPTQERYWSTKFAAVLLVRIEGSSYDEVWAETRQAEAFLDAGLLRLEKKGSVVDGYLVLALAGMTDELKPFMNEVEKDTRFVRKHVVYPGAGDWQRCQRITPLGLASPLGQTEFSAFDTNNENVTSLLQALAGSTGKVLARQHGKKWDLNE
ncbi:hypothetical protein [Pseudomonas kielensis]|uniref:Uncharacterized protein n=1 Tax=Pseudomonas kielensis TaxID=2762577 RepID=A0A7X1G985_9PSED|nr:hypothetical protein [Pseudomonas kielensis]MBC2688200.1 hypothetical protein [Pseudomonas kielensis]